MRIRRDEIVRSEKWKLSPSSEQRRNLDATVALYRRYTCALVGVVFAHYPRISRSENPLGEVERLVHATSRNPCPRYPYFDRRFPKFPSYLRRAAINEALGQVSSFVERYGKWQAGIRGERHHHPPRLNANGNYHPNLYRGQLLKFHDSPDGKPCRTAEIKVWNGSDWVWTEIPVKLRLGTRNDLPESKALSPTLILKGSKAHLSVPLKAKRPKLSQDETKPVLGVDLGISKAAVCSVVHSDGTVAARRFIHRGADVDRRDKGLGCIRKAAKLSGGPSKGMCRGRYRKGEQRNRDIALKVARELVDFAVENNCSTVVFEHLQGFRPKGGKRRTPLRQRFHGWLHRAIVKRVREICEEAGIRVAFVNPRGTSKYAYDGSGEVKRHKGNAGRCTFASGKEYDADLNASLNIAARWWVRRLTPKSKTGTIASATAKPADGNGRGLRSGESSRRKSRTPITLSTLWILSRELPGVAESEAPTTTAIAV